MSCLTYAASLVLLGLYAGFASAQQACSGTPAGTWSAWSPWNANCSDCASLSRYRNRACLPPQDGGCIAINFNCEGESLEALPCGDATTTTLTTILSTTTKPTTATTASTSISSSTTTTTSTPSTTSTTPKSSTTTANTTTTTPTLTTTTTEKVTTSTSTSTPTTTASTTPSSTPSPTTTTSGPTTSSTSDASSTTTAASITTTSVGDKCPQRPSLIAIDESSNSTLLTDSLNTAYNAWTRNSKANFNMYKKRIETIIYGNEYPAVDEKVALIADVLHGYAPEGSTYRDEVMTITIVGWGTVEEFIACE